MGTCRFCQKDAGFFSSQHSECVNRYTRGRETIRRLVMQASTHGTHNTSLPDQVRSTAQRSFIGPEEAASIVREAWDEALEQALSDHVMSVEEEDRLSNAARLLQMNVTHIREGELGERVQMARSVRELLEGRLPKMPTAYQIPLPFNFTSSEQLVWSFSNVEYYEERTRREYEGRSQGVSLRVTKGVYYRVGGFRGHPVEKTSMERMDQGPLALTTKHIYFGGQSKIIRIPYNKIVGFKPYSDALGVMRDAASARLQVFLTGNGWFTYNLVKNLSGKQA